MLIRTPALETQQIQTWIRDGAKRLPFSGDATGRGPVHANNGRQTTDFDFKKVRQAVQRARSKTTLRIMKPLRRLRTNQAAINESVIDALSGLITINKALVADLAARDAELAELRARIDRAAEEKH
jgi:hypothetical protein